MDQFKCMLTANFSYFIVESNEQSLSPQGFGPEAKTRGGKIAIYMEKVVYFSPTVFNVGAERNMVIDLEK